MSSGLNILCFAALSGVSILCFAASYAVALALEDVDIIAARVKALEKFIHFIVLFGLDRV